MELQIPTSVFINIIKYRNSLVSGAKIRTFF
nr:MAG TPA: hypothetical protein [Caudoviricetes sp.]